MCCCHPSPLTSAIYRRSRSFIFDENLVHPYVKHFINVRNMQHDNDDGDDDALPFIPLNVSAHPNKKKNERTKCME